MTKHPHTIVFKDWHQVKWTDKDGNVQYGIVDHYSDDAKKMEKMAPDLCVVSDAILPVRHAVEKAKITPIECNYPSEYDKHVDAVCKAAYKESRAMPAFGVGAMIKIGVADGYAHYAVVKMGKTTCKLEWRGFSLDRWTDLRWGYGKSVSISEARRLWERDTGLAKLFSKQSD